MQEDKELKEIFFEFQKQKQKIPHDMRHKLELLHGYILDRKLLAKLNQQDKESVEQFAELDHKALKLLFTSIVKSILSPKMYCSFQKNCKIKMEGYLKRWTNAYITFDDQDSISFNTFKKKLKFTIKHLEIKIIEQIQNEQKKQISFDEEGDSSMTLGTLQFSIPFKKKKNGKSIKMEFKYRGLTKLRVKFEHKEAAESFMANIEQMQKEIQDETKSQQETIKFYRDLNERMKKEYKDYYSKNQIVFKASRKQAKVHIEFFMKDHFWDVKDLVEFLITQKLWNSKIIEETINLEEKGYYYIKRRFRCGNLLAYDRATLSKLKFEQLAENQFFVEEEVMPSQSSTQSIVVSEMNTTMKIELMSAKVVKIILDASYNAKGYCRESDSRAMIIQYFSDLVFINLKFNKLKEKGKLRFTLEIDKIMTDKSSEKRMEGSLSSRFREIDEKTQHKDENEEEVFYTISDTGNPDVLDISQDFQESQKNMDDEDEESNSSNKDDEHEDKVMTESFKKKSQSEQIQNIPNHKQTSKIRKNSIYSRSECSIEKAAEIMLSYRPLNYSNKIKLDFLKLLREKLFEKCYLKTKFSEKELEYFNSEVPWYDPKVIISSGKEYKANDDNQLIFINQDLIQGQKDSLKFVIKQIGANLISGKSVLNVSLPVDIFESRSLLERSAASFGAAPKYLKPVAEADVLTQIKAVTGFLLSVPPMELIMQKPFNPILGQTFQAYIGGIPITYQQISHHPPISAYYMECEEFTLFGNLVAVANVSLNSGSGGNSGIMNIRMKNGNCFQVSIFPAEISGLIYGKRKYSVMNKGFVIQKESCLFSEVSVYKQSKGLYERRKDEKATKADILGGIFQVTEKFIKNLQKQKSLLFHSGLKKSDMVKKHSEIRGIWFDKLMIDGEVINDGMSAYPLEYFKQCLPSDSNFRLDVMMHRIGDLALSQTEKEILENIQRRDRKLRENK